MTEPLVRFDGMARTFGSGGRATVAVHEACGEVYPGDRIALVGTSGSGKSTLLTLLAGLDKPTHGVVDWPAFGKNPHGDPFLVGTVFQAASLVPALTAAENVALPLVLHGLEDSAALEEAMAALHKVGVSVVANQLPDELSGGQAQRVVVARVLASRPRLILADEPTGRLDHDSRTAVMEALHAIADEVGAGLVVATHDAEVYRGLPQRWRIRDGRLTVRDAVGGAR